jgi:hypothetical protein
MSTPYQVAADLLALDLGTRERRKAIVTHYGALLQTHVKRHANKSRTGPPGPRNITGTYLKSINRRTYETLGATHAEVGSNAPQARRLELGFDGMTDSLGREYHQPPYPHFAPGYAEVLPDFLAALEAAGLPTRRTGR